MLTKTLIGFGVAICLFVMPVAMSATGNISSDDPADEKKQNQLPFELEGDYLTVQLKFEFAGSTTRKIYAPEIQQIDGSKFLVGKNKTNTVTYYVKYDEISIVTVPAPVARQKAKEPMLGHLQELRSAYSNESKKLAAMQGLVNSRRVELRHLDKQVLNVEDEELALIFQKEKKLIEEELVVHEAALAKINKAVQLARYEYWVQRHQAVINGEYEPAMDRIR